jgi:filamentous hemagglutinin family protein
MRNSKQHRKLAAGVLFAAIAQVLWPAPAAAQTLPSGLVSAVKQGGTVTPSITTVGNTMTVTLDSSRSIYNWTSFDVGSGYTFNVVGASGSDLMVNRVLGGTSSSINGLVQSNANIWLLNPNGIMVGSTGEFDVGGLLLSTAGIADADLFDGNQSFDFSGASTSPITVQAGAQLLTFSGAGGIYLLADLVDFAGSTASAGENALLGSRGMTVTFDGNLGAITTLDLGSGSTQANSVIVRPGASFSGSRTLLMAAGMATSSGQVLLANPGGATDITFSSGSVELVSRDANVVAQGVFTTPGDLTIEAAQMFQGNGGPTVGGDYSITAQDFSGGVFNPTFVGTTNGFSITDTQGGLTIGDITAPGDLTVTSLDGSLGVSGAFGSPSSTNGDILLTASDMINLAGDLTTSAGHVVSLNAGGAIAQTAGVITTDTLYAAAGTSIALNDLNSWSAAAFNSGSGDVSAVSSGDWTLLSASSAGALSLGGQSIGIAGYVLANGDMTLDGDVVLDGDTTMTSFAGAVTLTGDVDGSLSPSNLTVNTSSGAFFNGDVGAGVALTSLTVNGDSTFDGTTLRTAGAIDLDDVTANNAGAFTVTAGGTFAATSMTATDASLAVNANGIQLGSITSGNVAGVAVDAGTGGIQLGSGDAASFAFTGDGNLAVSGALTTQRLSGAMGGSATLGGDNHIAALGPFASNGLTLRDLDSLVIDGIVDAGAGDVRIEAVNQFLQIAATGAVQGNDIALSSAYFLNFSGADALDAGGHWVVYQQAPSANNYDGLDSGNTALWGSTIATLAPSSITGNRYVFAFSPTLTFTSIDTTKTYGTDLSGATGSFFTVSGYQPGVAGAYLGDDATSAFSGAPLLTSAGFDVHASVAGGPYAIGIAGGSLASPRGYQFAFNGAGQVTVDPKALSGIALANTKTYDGTANGIRTVTLAGVVAGDDVDGSAIFTFSDANAGVGKTVTISGVTLGGADAGNYTLTLPASVLGDILQKALIGTAVANTKTYDGNANGSGTVTLADVVAGDDVSGSATFSFSDANAGTAKTVTVSGVTLSPAITPDSATLPVAPLLPS